MNEYFDRKIKYWNRYFNTGAYDQLMTEAPSRMFEIIQKYKQFPIVIEHYIERV